MIKLPIAFRQEYDIKNIISRDGSRIENPFVRTIEEESISMSTLPFENQRSWIAHRIATLDATRKIVNDTFNFNGKSDAEFGCGAYGWFYNYLLCDKADWSQFDINQEIVKHNKKVNRISNLFNKLKVKVGNIYNMPLEDSSVDVITGFSSWDSVYFFEKSVDEVKRCLKPGGFFVHYQDLHPVDKILILTEAKKRISRGLESKVPCGFGLPKFKPIYIPRTRLKIGETRIDEFLTTDSLDYGEVRLGEYLTKHLADVFREKDFIIHACEERQEEGFVEKEAFFKRLKRFNIGVSGNENCFEHGYGVFDLRHDASLPNRKIKEWKSMDVLVTQKPK